MSAMRKVLVTGGGGFIGKGIVRALRAKGIEVAVLGRGRYPELERLGVSCIRGDIREQGAVRMAVRGVDTVFHVAAKAGVWGPEKEYRAINVRGTEHVLNACRDEAVPVLVHTSTPSVVFDGGSIEGGDETLGYARSPLCAYARTKIEAEQLVLTAHGDGLKTAAVRPHLVWGPGDRNLIPRLLERGRRRQLRIVGAGTNRVDVSYIDNVVHLHLLAAENLHASASAGGQAFFIGQNEPVVLWQWINALFARLDIPMVQQHVSFSLAYYTGWLLEVAYAAFRREEEPKMTRFLAHQLADSHWFSHERAKALLGYREQVSTEQGLDRLEEWVRQNAL